jgi:hypothetical protein
MMQRGDERRDGGRADAGEAIGGDAGDEWAGVGQAAYQARHSLPGAQFSKPLRSAGAHATVGIVEGGDEQFSRGGGGDGSQGAGGPPAPVGVGIVQQVAQRRERRVAQAAQGLRGFFGASVIASGDGFQEPAQRISHLVSIRKRSRWIAKSSGRRRIWQSAASKSQTSSLSRDTGSPTARAKAARLGGAAK